MNSQQLAAGFRARLIEMSHRARASHLGSALSCIDLVAVLFNGVLNLDADNAQSEDRDRFILSKGHAASALYVALAAKGIISAEDLGRYGMPGTNMDEHPSPSFPGVEAPTGSLGHGLPIGCGMALAGRCTKKDYRVFVLMSDGECNEGSVWESAMFAARHKLGNVVAMVDYNKWQATGRSREVLALEPFADKWASFGWHVQEIDGHDHGQIAEALANVRDDRPNMIIAHTVKGKGVSFMEDDNNWHYRIPSAEEVEAALKELGE